MSDSFFSSFPSNIHCRPVFICGKLLRFEFGKLRSDVWVRPLSLRKNWWLLYHNFNVFKNLQITVNDYGLIYWNKFRMHRVSQVETTVWFDVWMTNLFGQANDTFLQYLDFSLVIDVLLTHGMGSGILFLCASQKSRHKLWNNAFIAKSCWTEFQHTQDTVQWYTVGLRAQFGKLSFIWEVKERPERG